MPDDLTRFREMMGKDGPWDKKALAARNRLARFITSEGAIDAVAAELLDSEEFRDDQTMRAANVGWGARQIAHKNAEHSGDCTNQSWTCLRCIADEYRMHARAILSTLARAALGEEGTT